MAMTADDFSKLDNILKDYNPLDKETVDKAREGDRTMSASPVIEEERHSDADIAKLERYDRLKLDGLSDDWQDKYDELLDWENNFKGKKPNDVLTQITTLKKRPDIPITKDQGDNDYSKRPTQEDLDKAIDNQKPTDYDDVKAKLNKGLTIFPSEDPNEVKAKYDEPKGAGKTPEEQQKINNYDKVKFERDKWVAFDAVKSELDQGKKEFGTKTPDQVKNEYGKGKPKVTTKLYWGEK